MKRKSQDNSDLPTKRRSCNQLQDRNDAWISFHQSSLDSFASTDYEGAIHSSLQALELLDGLKATVLDTCAAAYAMKSNFSKAMEAAEKMIACTPMTAAGYLRAGETLALQGKHEQAVAVCERGQKKVLIDDEQYAFLEQQKAVSKAQLDKRVDFITTLPADIAHIIIGNLSHIDHQVTCMNVSLGWRRVVAGNASAWRKVWISQSSPDDIFSVLPLVAKHVHTMQLDELSMEQTRKLFPVIHDRLLNGIKRFEAKGWNLNPEALLLTLTKLDDTLTELTLTVGSDENAPGLASILLACPRLERLSYRINDNDMCVSLGTTITPAVYNIKSLTLVADFVPSNCIHLMLTHCTNLQELRVGSCTGDVLKYINDHCPRLTSLGFNGSAPVDDLLIDESPGIRYLGIHATSSLAPVDVIQLLHKNQSTLRNVGLTLSDKGPNISERWAALKDTNAKNMKHLTYAGGSMKMHEIVAAMIQNCKALESVTLQTLNLMTSNVLDEALLTLPNLKALTLLDIQSFNATSFWQFFTAHAAKGKASSLRKVVLNKCYNIPDSVLEPLAAIETLEEIKIADCNGPIGAQLMRFISYLTAANTLKILHLENVNDITDSELHMLANMSSLREVTFMKLSNITADMVEALIEAMENLEIFEVNCSHIGRRVRNRIEKILRERKSV